MRREGTVLGALLLSVLLPSFAGCGPSARAAEGKRPYPPVEFRGVAEPAGEEALGAGAHEAGTSPWHAEPFGFFLSGLDDDPEAELAGGGVGIGHRLTEDFALRAELFGTGANQTGDNALGAGLSLLARWHVVRAKAWSVFVEGGSGVLQTDVSLPDGRARRGHDGTHFNFASQGGVGAACRIGARTALVGGVRFAHISNARKSGKKENPGVNAVGGYLGLNIRF
jgi:hypothetical protein